MPELLESKKWYAWIDMQPIQPTPYGTLHVTGEATTHPSKEAFLIKTSPQGINKNHLLLQILLKNADIPTKQPQQVRYSESLVEDGQYSLIEISDINGNIVETIDQIDIIH